MIQAREYQRTQAAPGPFQKPVWVQICLLGARGIYLVLFSLLTPEF